MLSGSDLAFCWCGPAGAVLLLHRTDKSGLMTFTNFVIYLAD